MLEYTIEFILKHIHINQTIIGKLVKNLHRHLRLEKSIKNDNNILNFF